MKMYNKKRFWALSLAVVLLIIAPWLFRSGYLFFTDMAWGLNINLEWFNSGFLFNLTIKSLSFVVPLYLVEKLFIGAILFFILIGGNLLAKEILAYFSQPETIHSTNLTFILSLFLLFNPFVYDRVMYGQFGVVLAYLFLIFAVAYLVRHLNNPGGKSILLAWLFSGFSFLFSQHFIFLMAPFFLLFYVLYFARKFDLKKLIKLSLLGLLFFLILNANWLAPFFLKSPTSTIRASVETITKQDYLAFKTSGGTSGEAVGNVLMMSGFWGKDQYRYVDLVQFKENWGKSFFLLLPFILFGVYRSLENKNTRSVSVGLLIIFGVSAFLGVGMGTQISSRVTLFLSNHLPFYSGMRETQKWIAVVALIYFLYLCVGIGQLAVIKFLKDNRYAFGLFLAGVIVMQAPLLLWGFHQQVMPVEYPTGWYQADQLIQKDGNCKKSILFFPWHAYMSFNWIGHIVTNPAPFFFSCKVVSGTNMEWGGIYDRPVTSEIGKIDSWVLNKADSDLRQILKDQNIGYVILAKEIDYKPYEDELIKMVKGGSLKYLLDTPNLSVLKFNDKP